MNASEQTDPWAWIPVSRASVALALSPSTIRRRIRDGTTIAVPGHGDMVLQGEREDRPQGTRFLVRLPRALLAESDGDAPDEPEPGVSDASGPPPTTGGLDVEELLSRLGPVLMAPLLAEIARLQDQLLERTELSATLAHQRDDAIRVAQRAIAERDAALAEARAVTASRGRWLRWLESLGWA